MVNAKKTGGLNVSKYKEASVVIWQLLVSFINPGTVLAAQRQIGVQLGMCSIWSICGCRCAYGVQPALYFTAYPADHSSGEGVVKTEWIPYRQHLHERILECIVKFSSVWPHVQ